MKKQTRANRVFRITLDKEVAKLAKAAKRDSHERHTLDWAARSLRDQRKAMQDALTSAKLPKNAQVEYFVGVVGHEDKKGKDVAELERIFSLEDTRV